MYVCREGRTLINTIIQQHSLYLFLIIIQSIYLIIARIIDPSVERIVRLHLVHRPG